MISYVWRPQLICSLPVYRVGLCSWSNHLKLAEMPLIDKHPHCAPWLHTLWVKLLSCYKCSLFHTTSTGSGQRDEVLGSQAPSTTVIYHAIAHHVPFSCSPTTSSHSLHMTLSCSFSLLELDIDCVNSLVCPGRYPTLLPQDTHIIPRINSRLHQTSYIRPGSDN